MRLTSRIPSRIPVFVFCRCIPAVLLLFIFSASAADQKASRPHVPALKATAPDSAAAPRKTESPTVVLVRYFHDNARCPTCYKLEGLAKSEVESDFADAMKTGRLVWKTINVEDKGNEHFVADYKLYTKSVIISTVKDGKELSWKNLDRIWQLVHNESSYRAYIRTEVNSCLAGNCR